MSDIVEIAARAMYEGYEEIKWGPGPGHPTDEYYDDSDEMGYLAQARLAIAAATPHIRAALFDELIQWAEDGSVTFSGYGHSGDAADCFREYRGILNE